MATGKNFPDALSAAPLAKQLNAPILLVGKTLDSTLNTELIRLNVKNVFIVGGEGAVSKAIKEQLEQNHLTVTRLAGNNRYVTSLNIANYIVEKFNVGTEIVVATGEGFPDALSIAPIAANKGMPIILSPKNQFPDSAKKYITDNKVTKAFVIGGTGVISDKVMQQLPSPERLGGADRFVTNVTILNRFASDISFDKTYVATGNNFPDALAG
ncbi:MAG: putative cell wall-binding protein [Clostridium sp.]